MTGTTQPVVQAGCLSVSIIHWALTWITGSFNTCVWSLCLHIHVWSWFVVSSEGFLCGKESAQNLTPEKLTRKTQHEMVTHPCGDHTRLCLTTAFKSERSRHVLPTLPKMKWNETAETMKAKFLAVSEACRASLIYSRLAREDVW